MSLLENFSERGPAELFLRRRGFWILLLFALGYYGWYYNVWPGPGGEGGVDALVAQRLLVGQRPFVDTFLGYNVMWFYPITGIFKLIGPNYLAMRVFFFALCLITGLLCYGIVLKTTGKSWAALLAGVLAILVPGQTYRNYMAFLAVLNMYVFLSALVLPASSQIRRLAWILFAGLTLGFTYLVRIDLGGFLSFILLGLLAVYPLWNPDRISLLKRFLLPIAGLALVLAAILAIHLPIYRDAERRGFSGEFVEQYFTWTRMISNYASDMVRVGTSMIHSKPAASVSAPASSPSPGGILQAPPPSIPSKSEGLKITPAPPQSTPSTEGALKITHGAQQRISIMSKKFRDKIMALNLYLPIPLAFLLGFGAFAAWITSISRGDIETGRRALGSLTALGCALTLFPQYFFWQPNIVHLSEFMVPMSATLVLTCVFAADLVRRGRVWRSVSLAYLALASLALVLYYDNALQSGGGGGIAVSQHKHLHFHGSNGTDVVMMTGEYELNSSIRDIVQSASDPGEFVICYPYQPEINFYTDRPSYEKNVYADNDIPGDKFYSDLLANEAKHHPVVFILDNWDINATPDSRFYNWAWKAYRHINENYRMVYRHGDFEVYVRPDRVDRIPQKFRLQTVTPTP